MIARAPRFAMREACSSEMLDASAAAACTTSMTVTSRRCRGQQLSLSAPRGAGDASVCGRGHRLIIAKLWHTILGLFEACHKFPVCETQTVVR